MKDTFSKDNLPLIERIVHRNATPRDHWTLMRAMEEHQDMTHQPTLELLLLARGAHAGDVWSMCQLARVYYDMYKKGAKELFPLALSLWMHAAETGDAGALFDLDRFPILSEMRTFAYKDVCTYADVELRCAMLTAYHLLDMGRQKWDALSDNEKIERADALLADVVPILGLSHVPLSFVPDLSLDGTPVDGLAHTKGNIEVRYALLADLERLVTVLFHELGHQLLFAMWNADDARARALRALYEITPERAARWNEPSTPDCLSHGEKDPDTLSYGVYTAFGLLFL